MPSVTFLVTANVPEVAPESLANDAAEMADLLSGAFDIESVAPWARPTQPAATPAGGFTSLQTPPPQ